MHREVLFDMRKRIRPPTTGETIISLDIGGNNGLDWEPEEDYTADDEGEHLRQVDIDESIKHDKKKKGDDK